MKIEEIKYKDFIIETFYDQDAFSPDEDGDESLFLVYGHRDFYVSRKGFKPEDIFYHPENYEKAWWVFTVYAYIHGGVVLSLGRDSYPFTDHWDVSSTGFLLASKEEFKTKKEALQVAEALIEYWNQYLTGDVYGYKSEAGSCWGFFGKEGYGQMIEEAKGEIDYLIEERQKERNKKLKSLIKSKVPIEFRKLPEVAPCI